MAAISPETTSLLLQKGRKLSKVLVPNQLRDKSVGTKLLETNQSTLSSWDLPGSYWGTRTSHLSNFSILKYYKKILKNELKEVRTFVKRYQLKIERFNSFSRCSLTMFRLR